MATDNDSSGYDKGIYKFNHSDYYDFLGIDKNASEDEILNAYHDYVQKYHPDVSDDPNARELFKHAARAREVLTDPERRSEYDSVGHGRYVREEYGTDVSIGEDIDDTAGSDMDDYGTSGDIAAGGLSDEIYGWEKTRGKVLSNAPTLVWDRFRRVWISRVGIGAVLSLVVGIIFSPMTPQQLFIVVAGSISIVISITGVISTRRLNIGSPTPNMKAPRGAPAIASVSTVALVTLAGTGRGGTEPFTAANTFLQLKIPTDPVWIASVSEIGLGTVGTNAVLLSIFIIALISASVGWLYTFSRVPWHDRFIMGKFIFPPVWEAVAFVLSTATLYGLIFPTQTPPGPSVLTMLIPWNVATMTYATASVGAALMFFPLLLVYAARSLFVRQRDMDKILTE